MLFKQKPCSSCQSSFFELERIQKQLDAARREVSRLNKVLNNLSQGNNRLISVQPSDQISKNLHPIESFPNSDERRQKAALAYGFPTAQISLREEAVIQSNHSIQAHPNLSTSEEVEPRASKKFKMSENDRVRLNQKRADLKARLGPNAEETREIRQQREREEQIEAIKKACEKHFSALVRNLRRSQVYNDYNALVADGRVTECGNFLQSLDLKTNRLSLEEASNAIISTVEELADKQSDEGFSAEGYPDDGWEFEHWVAEALEKFGWQARATQGSGDQGVDVVAAKDGLSLGIQCKRYSGSVGNKAVQEAYSGAKYMGLNKAAVLTNANFTKSAKELAASTGVLLLSPEDIPTLSDRFSGSGA
ncbi:hypothetical protein OAN307_c18070 [Octadecabacter antarcticus 307]|uniref:Restriction endonuclease type IV Mrr domain-containing protein n=1 Tax=Octadecabacter antarcticus 307 TaxID=391626 RepID=M9RCG0_9RHOB|nr:restriction endonuclease [Octadecabacter antarcticus]AGI67465.1 hypothetical protein OAN307_c18070 [Octadecabacter antarcticus 307]